MNRQVLLLLLLLTLSLVFSVGLIAYERSELEYERVEIPVAEVNNRVLKGILAKPQGVGAFPTVIMFHGFSGSKEMVRPFSESFAKAGFLTLIVDLQGHGASQGTLREDDSDNSDTQSLRNDGVAVTNYLLSRSDVNTNNIAIMGHSMGGSTAIATSLHLGIFNATVIIGNSLSSANITYYQQNLNTNLLMAVGKYDELFDPYEAVQTLQEITETSIEEGELTGSFYDRTARKVIITGSDHIFEVLDPEILDESFSWVKASLEGEISDSLSTAEAVIIQFLTALNAILWLITLAACLPYLLILKEDREKFAKTGISGTYILIHSGVGILSFAIGSIVISVFGSFTSIFHGWFIVGGIIYAALLYRNYRGEFLQKLGGNIIGKHYAISMGVFLIYFLVLQMLTHSMIYDMRFVIPVHAAIPSNRILMFVLLLLSCSLYFFFEERVLRNKIDYGANHWIRDFAWTFLARTIIFDLLLIFQFVPQFFGFSLLPNIFGFLSFFIIGLVPYFTILSGISTTAARSNLSPTLPAILAAGIIAWSLTSTLPIL